VASESGPTRCYTPRLFKN